MAKRIHQATTPLHTTNKENSDAGIYHGDTLFCFILNCRNCYHSTGHIASTTRRSQSILSHSGKYCCIQLIPWVLLLLTVLPLLYGFYPSHATCCKFISFVCLCLGKKLFSMNFSGRKKKQTNQCPFPPGRAMIRDQRTSESSLVNQ